MWTWYLCVASSDWTIAQIPDCAADLDQLIADVKVLRVSIEVTSGGSSVYISQLKWGCPGFVDRSTGVTP